LCAEVLTKVGREDEARDPLRVARDVLGNLDVPRFQARVAELEAQLS
jgi:hypothetical protein